MKKLIALLLALVMVFALVACTKTADKPAETTEKPAEATEKPAEEKPAEAANLVGVAMPTKDLQRWNQDGENMKAMLEAAGYQVDLQYGANEIATQVSQIENMIANGCKVLVIASIDGDSLGTVLAQAKEKNIPVIAYDRLIMNSDAVSYYATFDNWLVGTKQGEFIRDALDLEDQLAETPDAPEKSVLIVFFTPANSDTADAVSSATPRVGDVSSVEYVAQLIAAQVDADMAKIVPTDAYPLPYNDAADQAKRERDNGDRPSFTLDVNPEDYDTIFIGYPLWWYELPMILQTFFESYDFSGKTLIPFNTHGGSRDSGTYEYIAALEPNATVLDGLAVSGDRAGKAADDVADWLARLGY